MKATDPFLDMDDDLANELGSMLQSRKNRQSKNLGLISLRFHPCFLKYRKCQQR